MRVRDVMHVQPITADVDTPIRDVAWWMAENCCGEVPVTENNRLVGVVTDRDITCRAVAEGKDPYTTPVREIMTTSPARIRQDERLSHAIRLMEEMQVRRLPVVTGDGGTVVGIISMTDICLCTTCRTTGILLREVSRHREPTPPPVRGPEVFPPYL
jgi:CBS domain-containing protein